MNPSLTYRGLFYILISLIVPNEICTIRCDVYEIPSVTNGSCVESCRCFTLSQFAANSNHLMTQKTTLLLLNGIHTLKVNLSVSSVQFLIIKSKFGEREGVFVKFAKAVTLTFNIISHVYISSITFIGEASFRSALDGGNCSTDTEICGAAIVTRKSKINITNSYFTDFCGSQWNFSNFTVAKQNGMRVGGAIISTQSIVRISDSKFDNNSAQLGGAVYAETDSVIRLVNSTFSNHIMACTGKCYGGVIFTHKSSVDATACLFSSNTVRHNDPFIRSYYGGVFGLIRSKLAIKTSTFRGNLASSGGIFYCYHCSYVLIFNTSVLNNTAQYAGGVAFITKSKSIRLHNSTFQDNRVKLSKGGAFWVEKVHYLSIVSARFLNNSAGTSGGAINCASKCTIKISHSHFTRNYAISSGGGALFLDRSTVSVYSTTFSSNSALAGGAILLIYSQFVCNSTITFIDNKAYLGVIAFFHSSSSFEGKVLLKDNTGSLLAFDSKLESLADITIVNNTHSSVSGAVKISKAQQGGGISCILSRIVLKGSTLLHNNQAIRGGGIYAVSSSVFLSSNISISSNSARETGGGIYLYQSQIVIQSETRICGNTAKFRGGGVHAIGSSITLRLVYVEAKTKPVNYLTFVSNNAHQGGGLSLEVNSKLFVSNTKSRVFRFINNSAKDGGAIYVADKTNFGTCDSNQKAIVAASEADCFFQSMDTSKAVILEDFIDFINNTATRRGAILFGGLLDRCTVNDVFYSQQKNFINLILNDIASAPVRVCLCHNHQVNCSHRPGPFRVKKGEMFNVQVAAVDQVNNTLKANISSSLSDPAGFLIPSQKLQIVHPSCTNLTFKIHSPKHKVTLNLHANGPCEAKGISNLQLEIAFLHCTCPAGFQLSKSKLSCKCDCDHELHPFITKCNISTSSIIRQCDAWITALSNATYLIVPHCPFDYCIPPSIPVSVNLNIDNGSDAQCAFNRSGKLCGVCKESLSLSLGSSHCLPCPRYWPILFLLITLGAVLAGFLLTLSLLMLGLTVALGSLNGLIFFANIIDANHSVFLPFYNINFSTVFIAWLNLDIGFDVCYIQGLTAYTKAWLEFAFPSYIVLLIVLIIVLSQYSTRFAQLIGRRNPVATLATLIILSYTKLLQNIITVLSFASLKYPNGTREIVWLPDATVHYFEGKHIPLFLVTVVILILGTIYTLLLVCWQWINHLPDKKAFKWIWNPKLISFIDAYHAPYKPKYRYWTGMLLLCRIILYMISSINISTDTSINLLSVIIVIACLLLLKGNNAYKRWTLDILESGFYLILLMFCAAKFYTSESNGSHANLSYIAIGIALVLCLCLVCDHVITQNRCFNRFWQKDKVNFQEVPQLHDDREHNSLLDNSINFSSDESSQEFTYP